LKNPPNWDSITRAPITPFSQLKEAHVASILSKLAYCLLHAGFYIPEGKSLQKRNNLKQKANKQTKRRGNRGIEIVYDAGLYKCIYSMSQNWIIPSPNVMEHLFISRYFAKSIYCKQMSDKFCILILASYTQSHVISGCSRMNLSGKAKLKLLHSG
jgi:hypothetical protein